MGDVTFHFLHFSIQEYMAASYISTLSDNQQIKLLNKTFWDHRYYNTWIMYVGITCGNSFALKHFLSGNWFQLFTKAFKTSNISKKILRSKIKCLHLFQCLIESNNDDMIASVSKIAKLILVTKHYYLMILTHLDSFLLDLLISSGKCLICQNAI